MLLPGKLPCFACSLTISSLGRYKYSRFCLPVINEPKNKDYLAAVTIEAIVKFIETEKIPETRSMQIDFKKRNSIRGFIVELNDAADLRAKNFWRIVSSVNFNEWKRTGNLEFAKIYSGAEFTKLSVANS
jgi:hypothetical protein